MNYQVNVMAEAFANVFGSGDEVTGMDRIDAKEVVDYLSKHGWRITREDTADLLPSASDGPIQRALGLDGGDGF